MALPALCDKNITVEVLLSGNESAFGTATVNAAAEAARMLGLTIQRTDKFRGGAQWLCLWGVGNAERRAARKTQSELGGHTLCWDIGYTNNGINDIAHSYTRVSIDFDHPHRMLDVTSNNPSRWASYGVSLRNDFNANGPIIVVGMGPKSHVHLGIKNWEITTLEQTAARFPDKKIIYRPKPHRGDTVPWKYRDEHTPIARLLRGASLVICRHSNVAIDACIAGIPVECEDGAAYWLYRHGVNPTYEQRRDFLCRMMYWQWKLAEMPNAWKFLLKAYASHLDAVAML